MPSSVRPARKKGLTTAYSKERVKNMKLEEIQTLHAETQHEALLLANLARRKNWMPAWVKHIWKLTLPVNSDGKKLLAAILLPNLNLPRPENNMARRMGL